MLGIVADSLEMKIEDRISSVSKELVVRMFTGVRSEVVEDVKI